MDICIVEEFGFSRLYEHIREGRFEMPMRTVFNFFPSFFFLLNGTKLGTVGFNDIKKVTKSTVCPTNNIYRHIGLFVTSKKICSLSTYNSNISLDFPFP